MTLDEYPDSETGVIEELLAKMEELRNRLIEKQLCREPDGVHARRAEEFMRAQQKEAEPDHKADLEDE